MFLGYYHQAKLRLCGDTKKKKHKTNQEVWNGI